MWIVLPAYNESKIIKDVIKEIQDAGYQKIILVDDGSTDDTYAVARSLPGIIALRHKINRGKGAATKTGIEASKKLGCELVVTLDSDGQHNPEDIARLIQPILNGKCDVALGTRLKNPKGMPWYKILANHIGNAVTWYIYGLWVSDSQSGFRAYSRHAVEIINTKTDRYEYDSEVIREIYLHKLRYSEVPIEVRYTEYSMGKIQKQGFVNGLKTLYKIIWHMIS
ncbi:MAG: glycosyltransferase family 2 protein [Candidatus Moranbacteria bacterium]|nr:glycosyltransferase family 2 protein [Candidatus Moranbacteria bacterium]